MSFQTSDICNKYVQEGHLQIAESILKSYGGHPAFSGWVTTLKLFEDNSLIRSTLAEKVVERVLVIDAGGSKRCASLDAELVELAIENGWQGIVIYGSIRGSVFIKDLPIGLFALNTHPLGSDKHGHGDRDVMITFAGVNFKKDHYLYADSDGIVVSETKLD